MADNNGKVENKHQKSAPKKQMNNSNGKSAQNRQNAQNARPSVNNNNRPVNVGARMNIREQTPAKRRTAKEIKKINPDSPEIKRTAKRAQGYKIKKKKKKINPVVVVNAILFYIYSQRISLLDFVIRVYLHPKSIKLGRSSFRKARIYRNSRN